MTDFLEYPKFSVVYFQECRPDYPGSHFYVTVPVFAIRDYMTIRGHSKEYIDEAMKQFKEI